MSSPTHRAKRTGELAAHGDDLRVVRLSTEHDDLPHHDVPWREPAVPASRRALLTTTGSALATYSNRRPRSDLTRRVLIRYKTSPTLLMGFGAFASACALRVASSARSPPVRERDNGDLRRGVRAGGWMIGLLAFCCGVGAR